MLNPHYILRKMVSQDINEIMAIEQNAFSMPWSRESYLAEMKNHFAHYVVCDIGGKIAGYGGIWIVFEEAHITNVAVGTEFRRQGLGTAIMLELEKLAREKKAARILLEVRPSNEPALRTYRKLNYLPNNVRTEYYTDNGEDALIMIKLLF
ncbi:MAG TPA: ribosomal protein S18-alanine N-acetyltransferase [Syntrophomonadaceae bacterium]|nr:ribosomal protein S18-alanine N-acetyltransferase [Syntrophomonadaceae bacterium]HNX29830.1 ribosomal protein S18-alanine N-acetyltransferase [Syntrophomonadaceae bacterium]HPR92933.1 ribosomal protein S18-alanine N-acetyltransferase [Syntrophomonadaceae bacterium]